MSIEKEKQRLADCEHKGFAYVYSYGNGNCYIAYVSWENLKKYLDDGSCEKEAFPNFNQAKIALLSRIRRDKNEIMALMNIVRDTTEGMAGVESG